MPFQDTLNGLNLFDTFNLVIQTGTAELLEFPERKEILSNDWREENGQEYDLENPTFKDKEITLSCAIATDTDAEFWTNYNALFNELKKEGFANLFIWDHGKNYDVFYKKSSSFRKATKRLKNVNKIFVKFNLTFQVKS